MTPVWPLDARFLTFQTYRVYSPMMQQEDRKTRTQAHAHVRAHLCSAALAICCRSKDRGTEGI